MYIYIKTTPLQYFGLYKYIKKKRKRYNVLQEENISLTTIKCATYI